MNRTSTGEDPAAPSDPADAADRNRIATDLGATLFVEAGAGTGKTTALVSRIVELVTTGTGRLSQLAAITFTEAAAAELRDRVGQALEGAARDAPGAAADRAREALAELPSAAVTTLHGFARRLLREHPVEAGLPPVFEVLDEVGAQALFERRWSGFLTRLLVDAGGQPAMLWAEALSVHLDHLRRLALAFDEHWDLVSEHQAEVPPLPDLASAEVLAPLDAAMALAGGCTDGSDRLATHLQELGPWRRRLAAATGSLDVLEILVAIPPLRANRKGRQGNWQGSIGEVREHLDRAAEARDELVRQATWATLAVLAAALGEFTAEGANERRRLGRLSFTDLLVLARDLVRRPDTCAEVARQYRHLLVDEFQDTDPVQAELAMRLAARTPGGCEAGDESPVAGWLHLVAEPGRLSFVGDPKQSIYGFRRADLRLYFAVAERHQPPVALTSNWRSVPAVVEWVNAVFSELLVAEPGVQAPYRRLHAGRGGANDHGGVLAIGGPIAGARAAEVHRVEADELATTAARMVDERWPVADPSAGGGTRPVRPGDMAVLLPTRRSLSAVEASLDRAGLAYQVVSSSLVYGSSEVRDLLHVLRAVADPTDEVAAVAALRSPLAGCGDDELVAYRLAGGGWCYLDLPPTDRPGLAAPDPRSGLAPDPKAGPAPDPRAGPAPAARGGRVAAGLGWLHGLALRSRWEDPARLIERILSEGRAYEAAIDDRRYRDTWRRLRFVTDQARQFVEASGPDLRGYLRFAGAQAEDGARVTEVLVPEADLDAVRIMTVHAAKGLEFPVVLLAGLGKADRAGGGVQVLFGADGRPEIAVRKDCATPGFAALHDAAADRQRAEDLRLLYVAATRARDHLVVSLHHVEGTPCHAAVLHPLVESLPGLWRRLEPATSDVPAALSSASPAPTDAPAAGALAPDEAGGAAARRTWLERRRGLLAPVPARTVSATAVADLLAPAAGSSGAGPTRARRAAGTVDFGSASEDGDGRSGSDSPDGSAPQLRRGRGATARGRAVHAVLQQVDLATGEGVEALALAAATDEGIPGAAGEVARLAGGALGADVVRAAVSSGRYWREVYVGAPVGGRVLEGFVDLLVERPEGLVVVDYKTDRLQPGDDPAAAAARHRYQGASYAVAVEAALGRPVAACCFLFLAVAPVATVSVGELAEAKSQVMALLDAG